MFEPFVDLYLFFFPLSYWLCILVFPMSSDFFMCVIDVVCKPKLYWLPLFLYYSNSSSESGMVSVKGSVYAWFASRMRAQHSLSC